MLHGGRAGSEIKSFPWSSALENNHCGREGLRASWQICAEDDG